MVESASRDKNASRCPAEFAALAHHLADVSGPIIRRHFRQPIAVDHKADATPVTIADRDAEAAIRAAIVDAYPGHGIIGEEHGTTNGGAEYVWVIDPIDGTKSFITGKPVFGTLIALLRGGRPILGIIDQPVTGERWTGAAGLATTLNGEAGRTRSCGDLGHAALDATSPDMFEGADAHAFARLCGRAGLVRHSMDCYAYAMLATGFVDLVVEATMNLYDFAALVPVVEGAGGMITDWQGEALGAASDGRVIAAGDARMHEAARKILTESPAA